jgi:squalene synthase HpnC
MAVDHYENFPVASILLPKDIRGDVVNLYRFARAGDDIADEGDLAPRVRLQKLAQMRQALNQISENPRVATLDNNEWDLIFLPLAQTIAKHALPITPLGDLLSAFEQDVHTKRYLSEDRLMDYCTRSANPVGRLMLHLFKQTDPQSLQESDAICTALQRINFLQDVAIDLRKDRVYLPEQAMHQAGVSMSHLTEARCDQAWRDLMRSQIHICRDLMRQGAPLGRRLTGRIGLEIRLIIQGGLRILEKIEHIDFDVFHKRPSLKPKDWGVMLYRAL